MVAKRLTTLRQAGQISMTPIDQQEKISEQAYIGLGSNLEQPQRNILQAIHLISEHPQIELIATSSLYQTAPVGYLNQADFINAVIKVNTCLDAMSLLQTLLDIEQRFGRQRPFKDAPRTLDLDLLLYGQLEVATEQLTLPHPRMHQRAFVMVPLKEIAPELMLPKIGNVQQIAESLEIDGIHKI